LDIIPAGRVEVLVDAGDKAGSFDLVSEGTPTGTGAERKDNRILGSVVVGDDGAVAAVPEIKVFPTKSDLRASAIDARRTVVFSQNALEDKYFLNGKIFDHDRIDTRVPLGSVEEWTIKNDSDDMHVFHIHQMHFQVTEINGQKQDFDGYLDTVRVPERGEVKIIIPFTDPIIVGKFVYHCHVLEHEDKGMMGIIEVYDPKQETVLSTWWRAIAPQFSAAKRVCGERTQSLLQRVKSWL
jgi:FtsP/CotA-like multicopper oxidase with cupredoxin domain